MFGLRVIVVLVALFAAWAGCAANAQAPLLDVISVKPNKNGVGMSWGTMDGISATNVQVHFLLIQGYHLNASQLINEPDWARSEGFDIHGKVADADEEATRRLTQDEKRVFFQQVLKERFGLVAHQETRELPEYALTMAKGGTKLVDGDADANAPKGLGHGGFRTSYGGVVRKIECVDTAIDPLLQFLSNETGRVVVDKAGLTGKYTFTLTWRSGMAQAPTDDSAEPTPDLFTAIQEQLGLKLEPAKGQVQVLVIDHVEKPTAN